MSEQTGNTKDEKGCFTRVLAYHYPIILILVIAAGIRIWSLEKTPRGFHHDEAYNGLDALAVLGSETFPIFHEGWELYSEEAHGDRPVHETKRPVFFEGNYGREPLFIYLAAASISLLGPTVTAVRLISTLAGLLAILGTYLVARAFTWPDASSSWENQVHENWVVRWVPITAAFFMAILFPSLHFSRLGLREILYLPIETFTIYFLWRGIRSVENTAGLRGMSNVEDVTPVLLRSVKAGWFALAGFFLGLGIYVYAAARFLPLLIAVFFLFWWLQDRDVFKRYAVNLLTLVGVSLLVALPLLLFLFRQPYYLLYRSRFVANRGEGTFPGRPWITWGLNMGRVARGLFWQGDQDIVNNLPLRPFLDPIQALFSILGLASIFRKRPRISDQFLLIWIAIMLLPGIVSGDAPHFGRLLAVSVPLALLISKGAIWLMQLIQKIRISQRPISRQISMVIVFLLALFSGGLTLVDYFVRYPQSSGYEAAFDNPDWQLGLYAATLPEDVTVYLTPTQEDMATILFAVEGHETRLRSFYSPANSLLPAGITGKSTYYLLRPPFDPIIDQIQENFPEGIVDPSQPGFQVFVNPPQVAPINAESQEEASWGGAISLNKWQAIQTADSLDVLLSWQALIPMSREYTVFVHLLNEDGELVSQLDRLPDGYQTSDWLPGENVIDTFKIEIPADITPGKYYLQSGFYHLATLERLGEPQILGEVDIK